MNVSVSRNRFSLRLLLTCSFHKAFAIIAANFCK